MKKLLIVDDHPVVLEGLAHVFETEGYEVLKADTIEEAMSIAKSGIKLSAMVVDLTVSDDADGISFIRNLRKKGITTPAIVYTMHEELWNIALLMESKVEGIVLKGERINELIEAVKEVENGGFYRSPVFSQRLSSLKISSENLTPKDVEILNLISNGVSTTDISKKMSISQKTIEYHRSSIIKKLDSKNMTQAIRNAVKLGILSFLSLATPLISQAQDDTMRAVDLGLSVKWADRNLGAPSPHLAGGYFAFGETEEKDTYNWDTYMHCDDGDMFCQHYLGEESICGTEYDVAHMKLGGGWRMPTLEEIEELIENCSIDFIAGNDGAHPYARFSATNDEFIDIPIVGYMSNSRLLYENKETEIVSGTMDTDTEEENGFIYRINAPYVLGIAMPETAVIVPASAHIGFQIRPVTDSAPSAVEIIGTGDTPESIYTIDGRRIPADITDLPSGIYIRRNGTSSTKFLR